MAGCSALLAKSDGGRGGGRATKRARMCVFVTSEKHLKKKHKDGRREPENMEKKKVVRETEGGKSRCRCRDETKRNSEERVLSRPTSCVFVMIKTSSIN